MESVHRVRAEIARWRTTAAQRAIDRVRGDELTSVAWPREPLALLEAAPDMLPGEAPAAAAHLARAEAERVLLPAREALAELGAAPVAVGRDLVPLRDAVEELWRADTGRGAALSRSVAGALRGALPGLARARREAVGRAAALWARLGQPPHADAGPSSAERAQVAEAWLADTDAVVADLVRAESLPELWRRLRWSGDGGFRRRDRFRRAGARWAPLGLERELARAVRVEPPHAEGHPAARVWVIDAGRDIRVVPSRLELGWQSELAAARAVGRGLARALVGPLPVPLRHASVATVPRALGDLGAQVFAEPRQLRQEGLGRVEADEVRRRVGLWLLLESRWCCAAILASPASASALELEARCAQVAGRALGVPVPPPLAATALPGSAAPRLRALLGGLRLWAALRERWDEDWYRNPRAPDAIRAACERGGATSVEAWCEELGAPDPLPRLLELL